MLPLFSRETLTMTGKCEPDRLTYSSCRCACETFTIGIGTHRTIHRDLTVSKTGNCSPKQKGSAAFIIHSYSIFFTMLSSTAAATALKSSSSSWLRLSQKTAIVTGAASGIGAAVTRALAAEGCHRVILVDRNQDKLHEMITTRQSTTSQQQQQQQQQRQTLLTSIPCNVGDEKEVQAMMQQAFQADDADQSIAPPSILINCAGITRDSLVMKISMDQWNEVLNVNLTGTFLTCREFIQKHHEMNAALSVLDDKTHATASIVNVGSVVAKYGNIGQANYASSKGGVTGLTKALAKECAWTGIRVNAVLPGFIDTEMVQAVPDKVKAQIVPKIALQRMGEPEDVANLILFLASGERSGYITGECIECSGMISL